MSWLSHSTITSYTTGKHTVHYTYIRPTRHILPVYIPTCLHYALHIYSYITIPSAHISIQVCLFISIYTYILYIQLYRHSYGFDNMDNSRQRARLHHFADLARTYSPSHPIIIGEWSDYYNIVDQPHLPNPQFLQAQLDTYNSNTQGWYFWNFKIESTDDDTLTAWSFFDMVDMGYKF